MTIEAKNITKTFGNFTALDNVDLSVPAGSLVALLGPSGSGKTTLLRVIAGLEQADSGQILLDGVNATERTVRDRRVGFVFQHYALFRHMSVFENVAFGLRIKPRRVRPSRAEIKDRVHRLLKLVQLDQMALRLPSQLSGGQRQRIALARALAVEPKVLLLDEPFGALDAKVRKELRQWLRRLHDEISITSVFVTHDQEEALEVADHVAVMNNGRIEQVGPPEEVYDNPVNPFVLNFLGSVNIFHGRTGQHQPFAGRPQTVSKTAYVRPYDVEIFRSPQDGAIAAKVSHIASAGPIVRIQLVRENTGELVDSEITRQHFTQLKIQSGDTVFIGFRNARYFSEDYVI
jgi:sulfate/thiosulfate transport system ATP-binding protein